LFFSCWPRGVSHPRLDTSQYQCQCKFIVPQNFLCDDTHAVRHLKKETQQSIRKIKIRWRIDEQKSVAVRLRLNHAFPNWQLLWSRIRPRFIHSRNKCTSRRHNNGNRESGRLGIRQLNSRRRIIWSLIFYKSRCQRVPFGRQKKIWVPWAVFKPTNSTHNWTFALEWNNDDD
jgi:hypothetical protein